MASRYSDRNTQYGSPSMDNRKNTFRSRSPSGSNSRHLSASAQARSFNRSDSNDPEQMTLSLVVDLKNFVRRQQRNSKLISRLDIEAEVAEIRSSINPDECNIDKFQRKLPNDLRNCPKKILQESMAYGNNLDEIKPIIKLKMNDTNDDDKPTDTSIENIIGPLKKLKKDMDRVRSFSLFKAVREFDDDQIDRANRLFFSQACRIARGAKDYSYENAKEAVKGIRESNCEKDDQATILTIVKTLNDPKEIRDYLNGLSTEKPARDRSESPENRNRPSTRLTSTNPKTSKANYDNDTSAFYVRPVVDPDARQSKDEVLRRFNQQSNGVPMRSPPRERSRRN